MNAAVKDLQTVLGAVVHHSDAFRTACNLVDAKNNSCDSNHHAMVRMMAILIVTQRLDLLTAVFMQQVTPQEVESAVLSSDPKLREFHKQFLRLCDAAEGTLFSDIEDAVKATAASSPDLKKLVKEFERRCREVQTQMEYVDHERILSCNDISRIVFRPNLHTVSLRQQQLTMHSFTAAHIALTLTAGSLQGKHLREILDMLLNTLQDQQTLLTGDDFATYRANATKMHQFLQDSLKWADLQILVRLAKEVSNVFCWPLFQLRSAPGSGKTTLLTKVLPRFPHYFVTEDHRLPIERKAEA